MNLDDMYGKSLKQVLIEQNKNLETKLNEILLQDSHENDEQISNILLENEIIGEVPLLEAFSYQYDIPFKETISF